MELLDEAPEYDTDTDRNYHPNEIISANDNKNHEDRGGLIFAVNLRLTSSLLSQASGFTAKFWTFWRHFYGKLLAICFLKQHWQFFDVHFCSVSGKIAHTGKKKKEIAPPSRHFPWSIYILIGYGSRPISARAVTNEPIASQLVRVRETSFAIQWMAIYAVIPLFTVWTTELSTCC